MNGIKFTLNRFECRASCYITNFQTDHYNFLVIPTIDFTLSGNSLMLRTINNGISENGITVGSDLSDNYLSGNLEDWGTKSAAYYCIDTFYSTSDLSDKF